MAEGCRAFNYGAGLCELCPTSISNGYSDIGRQNKCSEVFFYTDSSTEDENIAAAIYCPSTHPFPFLGGIGCCAINLADPYTGITTGARGYLTLASATCKGTQIYCISHACRRDPAIDFLTSLQIQDIADTLGKGFEECQVDSVSACQKICESEVLCESWAYFEYKLHCQLRNRSKVGFNPNFKFLSEDEGMAVGLKSTFILEN